MITGYGHIATCAFRTNANPKPTPKPAEARRMTFYKRGYAGTVHTVCGGDDPFTGQVGDDDFFGPKPTTVTISLFLKDVYLSEFFSTDDRDVFVLLEGGPIDLFDPTPLADSVWRARFMGWVTPFDASEPYLKLGYTATLKATCGINSLKDFPFYAYPRSRQFNGPDTILEILQTVLLWAGPRRPVWIGMRTWNAAQTGAGLSLSLSEESLKWSKIQLHNFKTKTGWKSCFTVLEELCKTFNARIQLDSELGVWKFLRVDEVMIGTSRNWVTFDGTVGNVGVQVAENPRVTIGPALMPIRSARLSLDPAVPSQKVVFDYGELYNILINGDFASGAAYWNLTNMARWYPGPPFDPAPIGYPVAAVGTGEDESPFGLKITGTSFNDAKRVVTPTQWQPIDIVRGGRDSPFLANINTTNINKTIPDPHLLTLSFDYVNINTGGPKVRLWIHVTERNGKTTAYSLGESGAWVQGNKEPIYHMPRNVYKDGLVERAKPTTGETFEIKATDPVPGIGNYTIYVELHAGTPVDGAVAGEPKTITYRNMILTKEIAASVILSKDQVTARTYDFDASRRPRKAETELTIGSQLSTRGGAVTRMATVLNNNGETPALNWSVVLADGSRLTASLQELCALGRLRLFHSHARTFEGDLTVQVGSLALLFFSELNYTGFVLSYKWNERNHDTTVRTVEILPTATSPPTIKRGFVTPDGAVLPMSGAGEILPSGAEPGRGRIATPVTPDNVGRFVNMDATLVPKGQGGGGIGVTVRSRFSRLILKIFKP